MSSWSLMGPAIGSAVMGAGCSVGGSITQTASDEDIGIPLTWTGAVLMDTAIPLALAGASTATGGVNISIDASTKQLSQTKAYVESLTEEQQNQLNDMLNEREYELTKINSHQKIITRR